MQQVVPKSISACMGNKETWQELGFEPGNGMPNRDSRPVAALAYVVIPQPWTVDLPGLRMESWRFFLLMLLVPTLSSALFAYLMPETPKFLQSAGREEDALRVYRRIYQINTGDSADNYPVCTSTYRWH